MSKQLIESIVSGNMLEASDMLEAKLNEIRERKMYEMKRMYQAEMFGMSKAEIEAKKKAGYRKAADVLGDPRDIKIEPLVKTKKIKKKTVKEETLDELTAGDVAKGVGYAAGRAIRAAGDVAHRLKRTHRLIRMKRHQAQSQKPTGDQDLRKTFGVEKPEDKKRPGIIKRNINTLMGREAGHVEPKKSPEEKEMERGGRVGKVIKKIADADAPVFSDLKSIGMRNL